MVDVTLLLNNYDTFVIHIGSSKLFRSSYVGSIGDILCRCSIHNSWISILAAVFEAML